MDAIVEFKKISKSVKIFKFQRKINNPEIFLPAIIIFYKNMFFKHVTFFFPAVVFFPDFEEINLQMKNSESIRCNSVLLELVFYICKNIPLKEIQERLSKDIIRFRNVKIAFLILLQCLLSVEGSQWLKYSHWSIHYACFQLTYMKMDVRGKMEKNEARQQEE